MAHAYIPGIQVSEAAVITKERRLPMKGEVLVKKGDHVKATDVVAKTDLPGNIHTINVANKMGIPAADLPEVMLKKPGDPAKKGEQIALLKSFFGLFKSYETAPCDGTVEDISYVTGQVMFREPPIPVEVLAYMEGTVTEIIPDEGVIVQTEGAFIQGIFGIGGESFGEVHIAAKSPDEPLEESMIGSDCKGKIVVGGSIVTFAALKKAQKAGATGVVAGGLNAWDMKEFLGYDLGVAITGSEEIGFTLVITEGFGKMSMAQRTFNLLKKNHGQFASINGTTQIRAGVMRPEIIIISDEAKKKGKDKTAMKHQWIDEGSPVRCIREPYFGMIGEIAELPPNPEKLDTGSLARILRVRFPDGKIATVPRANVEIIES